MKKHNWIKNAAARKLYGIVGACMDCGETRTTNLRGGTCPGTRPLRPAPSSGEGK